MIECTAKLNGVYDDKDCIKAKGFSMSFVSKGKDFYQETKIELSLSFTEGLELLHQLTAAAKKYRDSVNAKLAETGELAKMGFCG